MERTISVRSDRNIWDHLWRWFTLTDPLISVGRTECSSPFDKIVVRSPVPLFCILFTRTISKRAWLGRVCATRMYRSIRHIEFLKFQTGMFVEWKAPKNTIGDPRTEFHFHADCLARFEIMARPFDRLYSGIILPWIIRNDVMMAHKSDLFSARLAGIVVNRVDSVFFYKSQTQFCHFVVF